MNLNFDAKDEPVINWDPDTYLENILLNAIKTNDISLIKALIYQGADVYADDNFALCAASANGHIESVKVLLEAGADPHAGGDLALKWASANGHIEIVKLLKEYM